MRGQGLCGYTMLVLGSLRAFKCDCCMLCHSWAEKANA